MKAEFTDLSETRTRVAVEVPSTDVDREIERLSQRYRRSARVPGFRPGKAPARLIRQRMHDQILHEVAEGLVEKAVGEALRERGVEPLEAPSVRDVNVEEGRPLTFTATFETLPPVDTGEYRGLTVRRTPIEVTDAQVADALDELRRQAARAEPVDGRGVAIGDTVTVDLERRSVPAPDAASPPAPPERHAGVRIEVGAEANPPGFDTHVVGLEVGGERTFTVRHPAGGDAPQPAGADVEYHVRLQAIHQRVLPDLDDEFARSLGEYDTVGALRQQVADDLAARAERETDRRMRDGLLVQLAARLPGEVPEALMNRELDRRVERLASQLVAQRVDPRRAGIDWEEFRAEQRGTAVDAVKSTLVLDEIARQERIEATEDDVAGHIERLAARTNRGAPAMRALLDKEGGVAALAVGIRREKTMEFLLAHATIIAA